jgi:hypothetical protein
MTTKSSESEIHTQYISASIIALGVSVEALIRKPIPASETCEGRILSLFQNHLEEIETIRKNGNSNQSANELIRFIQDSQNCIAEEDLGGISELFSGHKATWQGEGINLIHNPERRDVGKIYTPYDVTQYMCSKIVKRLISKADNVDQLLKMRVLDPAVGSGAFCSQFVRMLWKSARRKWKLSDENEFRVKVCENMLHACDIDEQALQLSKVVMWISAGCPDEHLSLNFSLCDSLAGGPCEEKSDWIEHTGLDCGLGYDLVFGNPPYVRVKPDEIPNFTTRKSRNLYSAFSELSINLLNEEGQFCFIVPQSVVGANETTALREFLFNQNAEIRFQIFDSVPDFLFDQGKIESNTNTNINQRTAIIILNKDKRKSVYTSPLLRWRRREERDMLFKSLRQIRVRQSDIRGGVIPMLENKEDLRLYRSLIRLERTISDTTNDSGKSLFIPKAIRYFISAIPIDLGRPNTIQLGVNEDDYETVHVILNSNLFYWWWRVHGNGFQVEKKDIMNFPLLPIDPGLARKYSKKLNEALDECRVFKQNAGKKIPNINYNYRQDILQEIDSALLASIDLSPHDRVFRCKTNSLNQKMDALRGYKIELAHTTGSNV